MRRDSDADRGPAPGAPIPELPASTYLLRSCECRSGAFNPHRSEIDGSEPETGRDSGLGEASVRLRSGPRAWFLAYCRHFLVDTLFEL